MPTTYLPKMTAAGREATQPVTAFNERGEKVTCEISGEFPLTVRIDNREIVTLMTLGTHPEELALGYVRNQFLIKDINVIESVSVDWETESVHIKTVGGEAGHALPEEMGRKIVTTGCGQGTLFSCTIDGLLETKLAPATVRQSTIYRILKDLARFNEIYKRAGAVHACALCGGARIEMFVEDVGRHNAADTIAGKMWLERINGGDKILYTTGRLTSEIVMKAAIMEIPVLLSRSGITHMGLELAQVLGITMIARVKGMRFLVFNGHERMIYDERPTAEDISAPD